MVIYNQFIIRNSAYIFSKNFAIYSLNLNLCANRIGTSTNMPKLNPVSTSLLKPLSIPQKLLCGPGPSNMPQDVTKALSLPLLGHLHPEFTKIMDETKAGIQYLFQTQSKWTLAISGTGHCAMEAALINLLEPEDKVLVCSNGIWGLRFADLADRFGVQAIPLKKQPGQAFTLDELEQSISEHKPRVVFMTHGESSSGTLQNLEGLGPLCHKYDALLLVDSVAAAGGVPLLMDQWELDCVYTGSQKVLGCTPGICPIAFSARAQERILTRRRRVPSFYLDVKELINYWGCDDGPRRYHHTGPISLIYAIRESLRLLAEEGLESSWARHARVAQQLHTGLAQLGLELLVSDPCHRLPCVNAVCVPPGVDWKAVVGHMMTNHAIEIAGGLGPTAGQIWRIGLMGVNATDSSVEKVLTALKEALEMTPRL